MFLAKGKLVYDKPRVYLEVDQDLVDLYYALLPPHLNLIKSWAHITIVRGGREFPTKWGLYEGETVCFTYSNQVCHDEKFYWIDIYSKRIEKIRKDLGLPTFRYRGCFHCTIGRIP